MKYSSILLAVLFAFFTSCSTEVEVLMDFSGTYEGKLDCIGTLNDSQGEAVQIVITKSLAEDAYLVDLGDEVIFEATQVDNVLSISPQTINEDLGFDMVSMEGEIKMVENDMIFNFTHSVDDEGESTCSFPLIKI